VYQLYVTTLTPAGAGDLHQRYEQLRAKLAAEGLFEDERKRPLPRWPRRIGVVTSPVGVVWRDITNVMRRRYPLGELVLVPTNVQGAGSAAAIAKALKRIYGQPGIDLVILARGGGSLEDLWSFNEELVVRTIAAAPVPIIVGVGHESDVTLADFAADVRAPTPSAAAEQAAPGPHPDSLHPGPPARSCLGRAAGLAGRATPVPDGRGSGAEPSRAGRRRPLGSARRSWWTAAIGPGRARRRARTSLAGWATPARALAGGHPGTRLCRGPAGGRHRGSRSRPGRCR
jgi:hypothetical protein